jgi:hypothetical protein
MCSTMAVCSTIYRLSDITYGSMADGYEMLATHQRNVNELQLAYPLLTAWGSTYYHHICLIICCVSSSLTFWYLRHRGMPYCKLRDQSKDVSILYYAGEYLTRSANKTIA